MVHKAGAGPRPIPQRDLSVKKLVSAIKFVMSPSAKIAASKIAEQINEEVRRFNSGTVIFILILLSLGRCSSRRR